MDLSKGCADKFPLHGVYLFKSTDSDTFFVVCDHDFDDAIEVHSAQKEGFDGFLLQFHCHEPWKDAPYLIENIDELIELLSIGCEKVKSDSFNPKNCINLVSYLRQVKNNSEAATMEALWGGI